MPINLAEKGLPSDPSDPHGSTPSPPTRGVENPVRIVSPDTSAHTCLSFCEAPHSGSLEWTYLESPWQSDPYKWLVTTQNNGWSLTHFQRVRRRLQVDLLDPPLVLVEVEAFFHPVCCPVELLPERAAAKWTKSISHHLRKPGMPSPT